jgi:hypothetical protein
VRVPRVLPFGRDKGPLGCRCGHAEQAHEHYRRGTDCALCECARFRAGSGPAAPPAPPRSDRGERARAA